MKKVPDEDILRAYATHGSVWKAGAALGISGQTVHDRLVKLGANKPMNYFTDSDRERLRRLYERGFERGDSALADLAAELGRTVPFLSRKAREMGLTSYHRPFHPDESAAASKRAKAWHATNEHPRGMKGKRHTEATKKVIAASSKERWNAMTEDERDEMSLKIRVGAARSGHRPPPRPGASWKAGWREIGGQRCYFRSRWEANYARFLEFQKGQGIIATWEFEPETFWFKGIKRGVVSYLPDFRVTMPNGKVEYHEVKGWMDARSKTTLKRMAKYHPDVTLLVIRQKAYKEIERKIGASLPGWES